VCILFKNYAFDLHIHVCCLHYTSLLAQAMTQQQQVETVAVHDKVEPDADMESQQHSDHSPPPESTKHKSGAHQQQQDVSTTSTRDMLLQNALSLFMPGKVPPYAKRAATAAAADGAAGTNSPISIPNLPHLADSRELQLVAAAFAAGAAAGASGQLTGALPLLEQFSSGDISNSGFAADSAAPAATDAAAESVPAPAGAGAAAQQDSGAKSNIKASKGRNGAAANQKSTYRYASCWASCPVLAADYQLQLSRQHRPLSAQPGQNLHCPVTQ
jgi:hypothetical protein